MTIQRVFKRPLLPASEGDFDEGFHLQRYAAIIRRSVSGALHYRQRRILRKVYARAGREQWIGSRAQQR